MTKKLMSEELFTWTRMFNIKKSILPILILSIFDIHALSVEVCVEACIEAANLITEHTAPNIIDNYVIETLPLDTTNLNYTIITLDNQTFTEYFIAREDYIVKVEDRRNHITGDFEHQETKIPFDDLYRKDSGFDCDLKNNLNSQSSENPFTNQTELETLSRFEHDNLYDHLKENAISTRREEIENNPTLQIYTDQSDKYKLQYQQFLQTIGTAHDCHTLADSFSLPAVESYLKQLKYNTAAKYINKNKGFLTRQQTSLTAHAELKFLDALLSGKVQELLRNIHHFDLNIAEEAFIELKELWIWKRNHTFLTSGFISGSGESDFITRLGIDIMKMAERDLISRSDYIAKHANPQSFEIIQKHREKCIKLQQSGDKNSLLQEELQLRKQLFINKKNNNFIDNVCYAIAEKTYSDPITTILYNIAHASSLEKARFYLQNLETQIAKQAKKQHIDLTKEIKNRIIKQYGFDILEAGYNRLIARNDYIKLNNYSTEHILANQLFNILDNIQRKNLPLAHEELISLQKQVLEGLESLNITDPIEQKEFLVKDFGTDILEQASNLYKNRPDHQELVKSFIPVNVHYKSIDILNNSHDYVSIGQQFDIMAEHVFHNARLCKLDFVDALENHIIDSLHIIKDPQNDAEFVFNVTVVDHLLSDIQTKVESIVKGKPTRWQRSQELFLRGITKFVTACNPVNQVKSIYDVFASAGYHLNNAVWATAYELYDPITATQNNLLFYAQACESLVNSAQFTSDLTLGKLYLPSEEYQKRCDTFCNTFSTTPENIVDFVAQVAADFAFGKGLGIAFVYLKEIDALGKISNQATKVTNILKEAIDTHLTDNPILITTEGVALQMSNDLKSIGGAAKEVLTDSRAFIESMTYGLLQEIKQEILGLREKFACIEKCLPECAKKGFAEFKNGHIKIAYEHILGIELIWNDVKNTLSGISGFHHDFMGGIEKSGLIKFVKTAEKNGCYMADLIVDGKRIPGKTFFPQQWSREKVISKIYEAYTDFTNSGITPQLNPQGKYIVHGYTNEGIKIEMVITQKGHMKSAYPSFKEL
jgi:hypothetical protein